ncbi:MAG TPA: glycosyltransferase family 1 protein [Candidatus Limnocylindrales bacterium]|nr:glycosyltransferase family 1 protein [Candidatus Limnocylindrales bacterium]
MARLEAAATTKTQAPEPRGVRVVIDVRPLQEPERSPLTAAYLDSLLRAFAAAPREGESFVLVTRTLRDDPTERLAAAGLPIAGLRRLPPTTRALRSAGLTLDSFLLRGAEVGVAVADEPAVFHTAGGAVPLASRLPVVATLLDLAPWELPETYAATAAARFGHRLRARVLHDAACVIVCSRAVGDEARRHLHLPPEKMSVIPLAVDDDFRAAGRDEAAVAATRTRLGLPDRYLAFAGRYDARKDVKTLFEALAAIRDEGKPEPAVVFAVDAAHREDADLVIRGAARYGLVETVKPVIVDGVADRAALIAGARAFVYPAVSEATALPVLEALSLGVPVICSRIGALPEAVASSGIVVSPRDAARLAAAIEAIWSGGALAEQLRTQGRNRARTRVRTWADVARETRAAYAAAAFPTTPPFLLGPAS